MEIQMLSSFTIPGWCAHRKVSRSMFYKLRAAGKAPRTHNVGVKQLISPEADEQWVRQREAEAQQRECAEPCDHV
jgi:hypothetical protein